MEKRNSVSAGLCAWVISIVRYYDVVVVVEPKKRSLRIANDILEKSESALNSLRKRLSALQNRFDGLISQQKTAQLLMDEAKNIAERGFLLISCSVSKFHSSTLREKLFFSLNFFLVDFFFPRHLNDTFLPTQSTISFSLLCFAVLFSLTTPHSFLNPSHICSCKLIPLGDLRLELAQRIISTLGKNKELWIHEVNRCYMLEYICWNIQLLVYILCFCLCVDYFMQS